MTERTLARARAGYEAAFLLLIDPWEELQLHWQRILAVCLDLGEPYAPCVCTEKSALRPGPSPSHRPRLWYGSLRRDCWQPVE